MAHKTIMVDVNSERDEKEVLYQLADIRENGFSIDWHDEEEHERGAWLRPHIHGLTEFDNNDGYSMLMTFNGEANDTFDRLINELNPDWGWPGVTRGYLVRVWTSTGLEFDGYVQDAGFFILANEDPDGISEPTENAYLLDDEEWIERIHVY